MAKDTRLWIGTETRQGETSWRQFESARGYPFFRSRAGGRRLYPTGHTAPRSHDEVDGLRDADEPGRVHADEFAIEIQERALRALGLEHPAAR